MKPKQYRIVIFLLTCFLFLHVAAGVSAQDKTDLLNEDEIRKYLDQAVRSGKITSDQAAAGLEAMQKETVTPDKVEAFQKSFKPGTLTPADIDAGKRLLDRQKREEKKETEKKKAEQAADADLEKAKTLKEAQIEKSLVPEKAAEVPEVITEVGEDEDPFFRKTEKPAMPKLEIFGHKLFSAVPATFEPIKTAPVSNDYIIGPGDEIKILMWGRLDATYSLEVDNEGVINFPKIGPLTVVGLTFKELKELIRREAEAITGVNVGVTMGRLRTIQVFVLGEVKNPGVYTVSSLATVANALLLSGGPSRLGSLREVQVKRDSRVVSRIDTYDFLLKGDISTNVRLMPGDVVFVPQAGPMVSVAGNVNRPAVYELKDSQTLQTALALAGGLTPRAFNQRIQIERADQHHKQVVLDIRYEELSGRQAIGLRNGDIVRVFSILPKSINAVYLYGNVRRPGEYAYQEGLRILDVLPDLDGLARDTYFDYALIKRYRYKDMRAELIPFDLGRLFKSGDRTHNVALAPLDEIYVFNRNMFKDKDFAVVEGEVRKPGQYFIDNMKIRDVILKAGDLSSDADLAKGELIRAEADRTLKTIYFDVAAAMAGDRHHNLWLKNEDRIVIHSVWEKQWKKAVAIEGEVKNADEYVLTEGMRLKDLFFKAGRFTRDAYMELGHLYRTDWQTKEVTILTFSLNKALSGDPAHNLLLQDMDNVVIHSIWEYREKYTVSIRGLVNAPGDYPFASNMTVRDLILVAGNVKDAAYLQQAEVVRFDIVGGDRVETSVLNFNVGKALGNDAGHNFRLQPMDVVTIKEIPQWWDKKKSVTLQGEVFFPGSYPIRKDERLSSVIERAGGFSDRAYFRGAFFSRESVRRVQQQRIDDMIDKLEAESARLSSKEIQAALSPEDVAAHTQFVTAQNALIAKLKEARATGRVVMNIQPLGVLKGSSSDIVLEDGDALMIPQKPNTVNVLGAVYNPTSLIYDEKHPEMKFYLGLTGGPTANAEEKSIYVVRANGSVVSRRSGSDNISWDESANRWAFGVKFDDLKLYPGDTILVPERIVKPNYMKEIKDLTQILYQIAIAAGVTIALF